MSGNHHTKSFAASDIQKYLRGELSAPDMHAMEKAALDDPFLADALEGMTLHSQLPGQPSFNKDLENLQTRLENRVAPKQRRPVMMIWRAAAAVIILVSAGLTARYAFFNNGHSKMNVDKIAQEFAAAPHSPATANTQVQVPAPASEPAPAVKTDSVSAHLAAIPPSRLTSAPVAGSFKKTFTPATQYEYKFHTIPPAALSNKTRDLSYSYSIAKPGQAMGLPADTLAPADAEKNDADKFIASAPVALKNGQPIALDSTLQFKSLGLSSVLQDKYVFSGKVTDMHNNAIAGATLYIRPYASKSVADYQAFSTTTDKNGHFSLLLKNIDSTSRLYVGYVGYAGYDETSVTFNTDNRTGNLIQLKPQSLTLNEVVISGYGAKRKETLRRNIDAPALPLSLNAIPVDGWDSYNHYIDANKKTPGLDSTLIGRETISFIVNKSGKLSSFKIEQSISPAHDSAAIRLIQTGPSWKLMKGRNARAVVIISFP